MDLARPIEALIPGARGLILGVLICAGRELSTADIGRLAVVSAGQASRVLRQLDQMGLVQRREVPPAVVYRPVEENLVVGLLRELCRARDLVVERAAVTSSMIVPRPHRLSIYGSIARGGGGPGSDIDVCVVRPYGADDESSWAESLDAWRLGLELFAGSPVTLLEVSSDEWQSGRLRAGLWKSIAAEEVVLLDAETAGVAL